MENSMNRFVEELERDNRLRLEVADHLVPEQFLSTACEISRRTGTPVTEARLKKAVAPPYCPVKRRRLPMDMTGWFPKKVVWERGEPWMEWIYLGNQQFREPFYSDTIQQHSGRLINLLLGFSTPLACLAQAALQDAVQPAGFIFHVSRCGSTLVSQMLSAVKGHRVLSEPSPIDALLRARLRDPSVTKEKQAGWLKAMVKVLGHRLGPEDRRLFIKFDSWHIMALPMIHNLFPDVPILFLYRNPIEVLVSHGKERGIQMVPGLIEAEWYGASPAEVRGLSLVEYPVWVLEKFFAAARDHAGSVRFSPCDYAALPSAVWSRKSNLFGPIFSPRDIEKMAGVCGVHSKYPDQRFEKDSQRKRKAADPALRSLVKHRLQGTYDHFIDSVRGSAGERLLS